MDTPEQPDTFDQENATNVGELLKSSRLSSGEDLHKIASVLRINHTYLEAIEAGRFEELPGVTYSLGFVRAYSEYLGLESTEVIRRLKSQVSVIDGRSELDFPQPISEASVPGGAVIFLGIVVSLIAYGGWYSSSSTNGYFTDLVATLPERFSNSVKPAETAKEFEYTKKDLIVNELKNVSKKDERVISSSDKEIVESIAKLLPNQELNALKKLNLVEKSNSVQQSEALKNLGTKIKSYPVPQLKSQKFPDSLVKPLNEFVESYSDNSINITNSASETISPEVLKNNKEKYPEVDSKKNTPQNSELSNSALSPSSPELPPSVEDIEVQRSTLIAEPSRVTSVVPMDLIPSVPSISVLVTKEAQKTPETIPNVVTISRVENNLTENKLSVLTKNESSAKLTSNDVASIVIKAKTTSWIQVRDDTANEILLTRLLSEGDSYDVPRRTGLMLSAGNAGALDIYVDGKAVPPIGGNGDVRRTVFLNAAKLKAGKAVGE
jgi:cytoskeleton protein RodZ